MYVVKWPRYKRVHYADLEDSPVVCGTEPRGPRDVLTFPEAVLRYRLVCPRCYELFPFLPFEEVFQFKPPYPTLSPSLVPRPMADLPPPVQRPRPDLPSPSALAAAWQDHLRRNNG